MPGTFNGDTIYTYNATTTARVTTIERHMILLHSLIDNAHGRLDAALKRIERVENALQYQQMHADDLERLHNKFVCDVFEKTQKLQMHIDTMPDGFAEELLQIHDAINDLKTNGDKRPA